MDVLPFDILKVIMQYVISEIIDTKIIFNIIKLNTKKSINKYFKNVCENTISNSICYDIKLKDEYNEKYKYNHAHIALTSLYHLHNIQLTNIYIIENVYSDF